MTKTARICERMTLRTILALALTAAAITTASTRHVRRSRGSPCRRKRSAVVQPTQARCRRRSPSRRMWSSLRCTNSY